MLHQGKAHTEPASSTDRYRWSRRVWQSWLAWQLGAPAIQLDLYLDRSGAVQWLTKDLARLVAHRIDRGPMIIDGVLMLDALAQIDRKADFLVGGWFVNFANHRQKEQSRVAYRENIKFPILWSFWS